MKKTQGITATDSFYMSGVGKVGKGDSLDHLSVVQIDELQKKGLATGSKAKSGAPENKAIAPTERKLNSVNLAGETVIVSGKGQHTSIKPVTKKTAERAKKKR